MQALEFYLRTTHPYRVKKSKSLPPEEKQIILDYMANHRVCKYCGSIYECTNAKGLNSCGRKQCEIKLIEAKEKAKKVRASTNFEIYGEEMPLHMEKRRIAYAKRTPEQKKEQVRKSKETLKNRYGDENYNNPEKSARTKIERYGSIENFNAHLSKKIKAAQFKIDYAKANEKRKIWWSAQIAEDPDFVKKQVEKCKRTKFLRHGDENYCNIEKHKQTLKERYGVENASQIPGVQTKVRETNIKKFGANHAMQTPEYQEKVKQTNIEKYGAEWPMQNNDIKDRGRNTMLEKYGVPHMSMVHLKNLENMNADFISKNFISKGVLRFYEALEYFGYKSTISPILGILDEAGIKYDIKRRVSVTETDFLDELSYFLNIEIKRQWRIIPYNFKADGYITGRNFKFKTYEIIDTDRIVIEFLGDYWHGKPNNSELTYFGESFADLHSKTFARFDKIKSKGYRVLYIWESDYAEHGISAIKEY